MRSFDGDLAPAPGIAARPSAAPRGWAPAPLPSAKCQPQQPACSGFAKPGRWLSITVTYKNYKAMHRIMPCSPA